MKLFLREITEEKRDFHLDDEKNKWLMDLLARVDETNIPSPKGTNRPRKIEVHLSAQKSNDIYVLTGKLASNIHLLCSHCGIPFHYSCRPRFSVLFTKNPKLAGPPDPRGASSKEPLEIEFTNLTIPEIEKLDSEITLLTADFIDLEEVLSEQIQLDIPFQPAPPVTKDGNCEKCHTNFRSGQSAFDKLNKLNKMNTSNPFQTALKDYKVNPSGSSRGEKKRKGPKE